MTLPVMAADNALQEAVQSLCALSATLLHSVRQQQTLLQQPDAAALLSCTDTLNQQLQAINLAETARQQALQALQLDPADAGSWPLDAATQAAWTHCQQNLISARELNEANGRLLQLQARQTRLALDLLLGTGLAEPTYDPRGKARQTSGGQRLGSA